MSEINATQQQIAEANGHYKECLGYVAAANDKRQDMVGSVSGLLEQLMGMREILRNVETSRTDETALTAKIEESGDAGFESLSQAGIRDTHPVLDAIRFKHDIQSLEVTSLDDSLRSDVEAMQRHFHDLVDSTKKTLRLLEAQGDIFTEHQGITSEVITAGEEVIQNRL